MIINNFFDKIKGRYGIDNITIMYLLVIIGVGGSSFLLGRLSASDIRVKDSGVAMVNTRDIPVLNIGNNLNPSTSDDNIGKPKEKRYVASKNGKLYYPISCTGAQRIAEKNRVWFQSEKDAEKLGYTLSSNCK